MLSTPVLKKIFEHCNEGDHTHVIFGHYIINGHRQIEYILKEVAHFSWFYEQFKIANGREWLSHIGLSDYERGRIVLTLLVDQLVFETASQDLDGPLECTYICLQTLQGSASNWNILGFDPGFNLIGNLDTDTKLSHLRDALIWVLKNAIKRRDEVCPLALEYEPEVPTFAKIGLRRTQAHGIAPWKIRTFEFSKQMSTEEWDEWSNRVKTMVMGVSLGGLGCEPNYGRHRFVRDPDGICV
jgi:hypothetical protein